MKSPTWDERELNLIKTIIGERCIDINNDDNYDVDVTFYGKGANNKMYAVTVDPDDPKNLIYVGTQIYRNSEGDIIDEKVLTYSSRPRTLHYLKTYVDRIVIEHDNE